MHPIESIMQNSMEQIKRMVDVNTVIGDPVATVNQTMILPVSKVSLGFLVGGGEYGKMSCTKKAAAISEESVHDSRFPFAGTTAVGMCITPLAFLTVEEGNVRVLPAQQKCMTDRMMDIVPQMLKSLDRFLNMGLDCIKKKCECSCDKNSEENCQGDANSEQNCECNKIQDSSHDTSTNHSQMYSSEGANA